MVDISVFCFNLFNENTYLVYQKDGECLIIDPGNSEKKEFEILIKFIEDHALKPRMIINTHCHVDHVLGVNDLKNKFNIPFYIHPAELPILNSVVLYAGMYGFPGFSEPKPDGFIRDGERIGIADSSWEILHIPGHSPGHIALYEKSRAVCVVGDVLFRNSIGRTDLPGGDFNTLLAGIKNKLFTLPDHVEIFSGHGPSTSIGYEKKHNPFCKEA